MPGRSTWPSRRQTAVYWGSPQPDGYGGWTFDAAIELTVRWEDRVRLYIDQQGREQQSRATVFPDRELDEGGYLYLGTLDSLTAGQRADPLTVEGSRKIAVREMITATTSSGTVVHSVLLGDSGRY
jgi:hypothetical protein